MQDMIDSPIFGKTRLPSDEERVEIKKLCQSLPIGVFGELNKILNARGFCITIDKITD